jgi:hypothetical protein
MSSRFAAFLRRIEDFFFAAMNALRCWAEPHAASAAQNMPRRASSAVPVRRGTSRGVLLARKATEALVFDTIRSAILDRYPTLAELVRSRFPNDPLSDEAFTYALYLFLRTVPDLDVTVDGWRMVKLIRETAVSIRAVGIMQLLPSGDLPMEVEFSKGPDMIRYWIRVGTGDPLWYSRSESKRWNAVYLYAIGEHDEQWVWSQVIPGSVSDT